MEQPNDKLAICTDETCRWSGTMAQLSLTGTNLHPACPQCGTSTVIIEGDIAQRKLSTGRWVDLFAATTYDLMLTAKHLIKGRRPVRRIYGITEPTTPVRVVRPTSLFTLE